MMDCARFQSSAYTPRVGDIVHADHIVTKSPCSFVYIVCGVEPDTFFPGAAPQLRVIPLRNPLISRPASELPTVLITIAVGSMWHLAGAPRFVVR